MSHLVLKALNEVQKAVNATGIAKTRENREQRFNFRGIDDALNAFGPLLAAHGVLLSPAYSDLKIEARQTKSGGITFNASVAGTYTFTHLEDGSKHVVGPFYGEANDGQDKAVSKATSVAERNMLFLTFVVPHESAIGGDPDASGGDAGELDVQPWFDAIADANDMDALNSLANQLRDAKIPNNALRNIRAKWSARAKELK